mgnify:FL=1
MGMVRRRTRRRAMVVAGGLAYERGRRETRDEQAYAQSYEPPPPAPPPPAPGGSGTSGELEELASPPASGVLSDEVFAEPKAKALRL